MIKFNWGSVRLLASFLVFFVSIKVAVSQGDSRPRLEIWPQAPVQTKSVGSKVLLTCRIAAGAPSEVRDLHWRDPNNRTIDSNDPLLKDRMMIMRMPTDKSLLLIFQDLREEERGQYTCSGSYSNSESLSASVLIETIEPISWPDAPLVQNPIKGKEGKIKCRVNANPSPNVDWIRNNAAITSGDRYIIESDGLTIKNVQESDDGFYTCRAIVIQTGEFAERVIKVEVQSPPVIDDSSMIKEIEVTEGESASIACKAYAKPPPTYSWIKDSTKQNLGVGSERFAVNEHTGVLTLNKVIKEDNGEYRCVANNPAGTVERAVSVTVIVKPKIFNLRNISEPVGREAKLECQATGNPLPNISFRKLSSDISFVLGVQSRDSRISVEVNKNTFKGEVTASLVISQLRREDDGLYVCTATNKGGSYLKNGHLTVEFPPSFNNTPIKEAWSWNRIAVNLTCLAESIPNATITWQLNNRDIDRDYNFKKIGAGPESTLLVTPSDPKFYGHYRCKAQNKHGEAYHVIELKEAHAPSAVQQAKPTIVTANTINFDILGPNDHGGQKIKAYIVQYKEERDPWQYARNKTWTVDSAHILENLVPKTKYNFRFAAINDVGEGPFSAMVSQFMPETSAPQIPTIMTQMNDEGYIVSPFSTGVQIRWRIPANNGAPIMKYTITYCMVENPDNELRVIKQSCRQVEINSAQSTTYDFRDLRPDTIYKMEVRAQNQIGFSQPAQAYVRTAKGTVDSQMHTIPNDRLSSAVLVLVVVAALFGILVIVDVSCFFFNETGLLSMACSSLCGKKKKHPKEDDPKLGSEAKELLNGHRDNKVRIDSNMMDESMKKNMQVSYDMKKSISKTSFVGKDSAV